jgi:hypothetical protein
VRKKTKLINGNGREKRLQGKRYRKRRKKFDRGKKEERKGRDNLPYIHT